MNQSKEERESLNTFLRRELSKGEYEDMINQKTEDTRTDKIIVREDPSKQDMQAKEELLTDLREEKEALEEELEKIKTALDTVDN